MIFVKTVVVGLGLFAFGFLFVVEKMGGVLAVSIPDIKKANLNEDINYLSHSR